MISKMVNLFDICEPKQWPTISMKDLQKDGYPVFGANGKIGFYSNYNHEKETILITCRGATCGTVNICESYSYVTGNAMALDDLSETSHIKYIYYFLLKRGFDDVISGTAQPQITREGLKKVSIPLPPLDIQKKIATVLDKADRLRQLRKQAMEKLDKLTESVFLDMFGDPVTNPKGWEKSILRKSGEIITGNTPSRKRPEYYGNLIEWIKSDNINTPSDYITRASEYLSEEGKKVGRMAPKNSILVTCIAGSKHCIGNAALTDREVSFNQQINAIIPSRRVNPYFLYMHFKVGKKLIQNASTNSMKGIVNKNKFGNIPFLNPPIIEQNKFEKIFKTVELMKSKMGISLSKINDIFNSLFQRAFKGELEFNDVYFDKMEKENRELI